MHTTPRRFLEQSLAELDGALARAAHTADAAHRTVIAVARAYHSDPWDAVPDHLPNGLEDDLLVLGMAAQVVGVRVPAEIAGAVCTLRTSEWSLAARAVEVLHPGVDLAARFVALRAHAVALGRKLGWSGDDVDGAIVAPPRPPTAALTVALHGRTSCGKTTLAARLIRALAPAAAPVAERLRTSPGAHTTRAPLVLDFSPEAAAVSLSWGGAGGAGRRDEGAQPPDAAWIPETAAWANLVIPGAARSLRVIDLPGTHGHRAGPWSFTATHGLWSADAVILPMDQRFFRTEERQGLQAALDVRPERPLALALRRGGASGSTQAFLDRIASHDLPPADRARVRAMPAFSLARRADPGDDATALLDWLGRLGPNPCARSVQGLWTLAGFTARGTPTSQAAAARDLLRWLGWLRAIRAAMLGGGDDVRA